ncbi:hypothetical protein [uncultured Selenomonas sp.]|uniref:hypothetical protein n=1 Tax=uncultured Selenomonas sp. TaxID=159275 RepID=UPI00258FDA24|nr:hypothetical protein [uncultured Selenomonas sp.]
MSILPIPAKQYFSDFSFDLVEYQVIRKGKPVATMKGLSNSSHGQQFVSFLCGADIQVGDMLQAGTAVAIVSRIDYDTYNGQKQLINAYVR